MNFVSHEFVANAKLASGGFGEPLGQQRKWPIRYEASERLAMCLDVAAILLASMLSSLLYGIQDGWTAADFGKAIGSAMIVSALFASNMRGMYKPAELLVLRNQVRAVCLTWALVFSLLAGAIGALNIGHEVSYRAGIVFGLLGVSILIAERAVIKALLVRGLTGRKFAGGNIVLITDQPQSTEAGLAQMLATHGFSVTGQFRLPPPRSGSDPRKRLSARVLDHIRGSDTEEVVIEADPNRWSELRAFLADLRVLPCPVVLVPVGATSPVFRRPIRDLGSAVCVELQRGPLTGLECVAKRSMDLLGAGLALILLSPLLAATALLIRLDSRGPVLFRQQRCGFNGRSFSIYKFRTMYVQEDGLSIIQARQDDRRITRVGKWLRRMSIDELPQLFNVINGTMSLVGPRPHALAHDGQFDKVVRSYAFRRRVKPGLTGWAQIHGCRGPTPTAVSIERRVQYDLWYVDNWSLRLDLMILLRTPLEVLRGRNAY
jgi:putative colanic acid biosynthesis UDP-glucose lipid carrier transferase